MSKQLDRRVALITGASRGIGAAVARRYAKEGAHVLLLARTVAALEEVDDAIRQDGGEATLIPHDITDFGAIEHLSQVIAERFGRLDVLVGNAGFCAPLTPIGHLRLEDWKKTFDINLTANFQLLRVLDPLLRASSSGRVIMVTSGVARQSSPNWGAYAVSKAALEKLVEIYADEVKNTQIRVNMVDPGTVSTKMLAVAMPGKDAVSAESVTEGFVRLAREDAKCHGELVRYVDGKEE